MPVVSITNKCDSKCIMCSNPDDFLRKKKGFGYNYLVKRLQRFHGGEAEFLDNYRSGFCITGGEPCISPYVSRIIKKIDALFPGIEITFLTNGRALSKPQLAKGISRLTANLHFCISLHSHNEKLHDMITRCPGSFRQTIRGIKNILSLKRENHRIEVRIVIHRLNYKFLKQITEFIRSNFSGIDRLVYMFFEIEGRADKNFKVLKLTYSQAYPYIDKVYNFVADFPEVRLYHFPLCVTPPRLYPYVWRTLPEYEVTFPLQCRRCKLRELCLGVHNAYIRHIGAKEFQPVKKSNIVIEKSPFWQHPIKGVSFRN